MRPSTVFVQIYGTNFYRIEMLALFNDMIISG
jgi:hypothetical protein